MISRLARSSPGRSGLLAVVLGLMLLALAQLLTCHHTEHADRSPHAAAAVAAQAASRGAEATSGLSAPRAIDGCCCRRPACAALLPSRPQPGGFPALTLVPLDLASLYAAPGRRRVTPRPVCDRAPPTGGRELLELVCVSRT